MEMRGVIINYNNREGHSGYPLVNNSGSSFTGDVQIPTLGVYPRYQSPRQQERRISLLTSIADEVNDLGNGFYRFRWDTGVGPRENLVCFMEGDGLNVISGGFAFVGSMAFEGSIPPIYLLESFPYAANRWVNSLHNPLRDSRRLRFYLIAKRK